MYLEVLKEQVNMKMLKYEVFEALGKDSTELVRFPVENEQRMFNCTKLDHIIRKVMKICSKHSVELEVKKGEELWYLLLDLLVEMKQNPLVAKKFFCKLFFQERINFYAMELLS
mmetsp:Transcript_29961/g.29157  ORF Transcript_29961/g.29157 Transcript_29961/m.29157 type:complete len:114 (-) Transcript_29961:775-1116(-)